MKILVIDDHDLIRDGLRGALAELSAEAVVLEAKDCRAATQILDGCNESYPDLTLLDLNLPDRDGLSFLPELRQRFPAMAVVILAGDHDRANITRALGLGASGFIPKSASRDVMLSALRLVSAGGMYVPPEILATETASPNPSAEQLRPPASPSDLGLTDRQIEVLRLMMEGKSNKAISRALDLAESTVKNHVTAVLKALNAGNRTEAVVTVGKLGWVLPLVKPKGVRPS